MDASAVARGTAIDTQFKDLRAGNILYLPQRIAVIAQGASASVYSTEKFQAASPAQVGGIAGFGSPAHLCLRELLPPNGDGVGTIPIDVYLLEDDDSGVAAAGDIAPTGTQTEAASYRVLVNNIRSEAFVIPAAASVTTICRLIGEAIGAVLEMPVTVDYTYGTVTSAANAPNTGNGTVTVLSVTGTPLPGAYLLTCNTAVADGGVFTLTDPNGSVISTSITMTPGAGGATVINVGGIQFTLTDAGTDFAVGDDFTITVPASEVLLTAKWAGESGNDLYIEVDGEDLGVTFAITQPTGGLVNPAVDDALALFGTTWETLLLNALNVEDEDALDAISTFGEGRWNELVRKPLVAFVGNTHTTVAEATAISSTRRTDRVNAQLVAPGSKDLPCVVAARQLARIAKVANNNPPTGYGGQRATRLTPGATEDQWDYTQRDQAVKAGSSTIEVIDGVVSMSDVVTFYRPEGEDTPAYRQVVNLIKLQNILFNIDLIFSQQPWGAGPLIPDGQPTVNPNARRPKDAIAAINVKLDGLGLNAIISDPKTAKQSTSASINESNPDRLDWETTVQLSGNTNIVSATLSFGFFFGSSAVVG